MKLYEFEEKIGNSQKGFPMEMSDDAINEKYETGEARIRTGCCKIVSCQGSV